jgi:hypothetical protein
LIYVKRFALTKVGILQEKVKAGLGQPFDWLIFCKLLFIEKKGFLIGMAWLRAGSKTVHACLRLHK